MPFQHQQHGKAGAQTSACCSSCSARGCPLGNQESSQSLWPMKHLAYVWQLVPVVCMLVLWSLARGRRGDSCLCYSPHGAPLPYGLAGWVVTPQFTDLFLFNTFPSVRTCTMILTGFIAIETLQPTHTAPNLPIHYRKRSSNPLSLRGKASEDESCKRD